MPREHRTYALVMLPLVLLVLLPRLVQFPCRNALHGSASSGIERVDGELPAVLCRVWRKETACWMIGRG